MKLRVTNASNLEFAGQPRRGTAFDEVFEVMAKLKPGQSVLIPLEGADKRSAHNRLSGAIYRTGPQPPAGCRWSQRTTVNDEIAVIALPVDKPVRRQAKKKKKAEHNG